MGRPLTGGVVDTEGFAEMVGLTATGGRVTGEPPAGRGGVTVGSRHRPVGKPFAGCARVATEGCDGSLVSNCCRCKARLRTRLTAACCCACCAAGTGLSRAVPRT
jgi:hypothetical protein